MTPERITALVLAAGEASRMGTPKQLLPFAGECLVRRAAASALKARCEPVIVVTGSHSEEVRLALIGLPVLTIENQDWRLGMGGSIRRGMAALSESPPDAVLITLADQPLVTGEVLSHLIADWRKGGGPIVAASYHGTAGVPALFDGSMFAELAQLAPDRGCKGLLQREAERVRLIDCPEAATDLDTPDDYAALIGREIRARNPGL